jgi:dipeptidyl aminopeptidase/acylaminoacyl peptidase
MVIKPLIILTLGALMCVGIAGCSGKSSPTESHYWNAEVLAPFGHRPMPSPDGQWIAFGGTGDSTGIWVLDRSTGDITRLTDEMNPHRWDYQWTDDSQALVFGGAGESGTLTAGIWHVTYPGDAIMRLFAFGSEPTSHGDEVCFAGNSTVADEAGIWLIGIHSLQFYHIREEGTSPKFSPSGLSIAYLLPIANGFPELHLMSIEGTNDQLVANDIIGQEWLDNGTLICTQSGGVGVNIIKVEIGPSPQISFLVTGGSQFTVSAVHNKIAFQSEESGHSLGLHISSASGGQSNAIRPSGAYPQFLPADASDNVIRVVYEDSNAILMASSSSSTSPMSAGLNP